MVQVNTDLLEDSPRVRVRARQIDPAVVTRYAEDKLAGAVFPAPVVFREKGTERYIIADGHHRIAAERENGTKKIEVDLREGGETAALEYALSANCAHGVPRSEADVKRCVAALLMNEDLVDKYRTNKALSELLRMSERTFIRYKMAWSGEEGGSKKEQAAKTKTRASKEKFTANKHKAEKPAAAPKADKSPRPATKKQDANDTGWTSGDENTSKRILEALAELGRAWKDATRAAQIQTQDQVRATLKSLL